MKRSAAEAVGRFTSLEVAAYWGLGARGAKSCSELQKSEPHPLQGTNPQKLRAPPRLSAQRGPCSAGSSLCLEFLHPMPHKVSVQRTVRVWVWLWTVQAPHENVRILVERVFAGECYPLSVRRERKKARSELGVLIICGKAQHC